jgi:hypothetical protein
MVGIRMTLGLPVRVGDAVTGGLGLCEGFKLDVLVGEGIAVGRSEIVGDGVLVGPVVEDGEGDGGN